MITTALLAALIAVESAGDTSAMGDGGKAHGCLQIHREVVVDVNRLTGSSYRLADAYSKADAEEICRAYLKHYASRAELGREPTDEDRARIWNGGPEGYRKAGTVGYWRKVRHELAAQPVRFTVDRFAFYVPSVSR